MTRLVASRWRVGSSIPTSTIRRGAKSLPASEDPEASARRPVWGGADGVIVPGRTRGCVLDVR